MKSSFCIIILLVHTQLSFAQGKRYVDDQFDTGKVATVAYGADNIPSGRVDTLFADIYTPAGDSLRGRAMIVFMHGGGFHAGHRSDPAVVEACNKLVKKGYVVASIDYTLGTGNMGARNLITYLFRAVQDLNGFIRFAKANSRTLDIDTNKIFISGASAGGITVLTKAFIKLDSSAARFGITAEKDLEGSVNDLTNTNSVSGVYALWGAIMDTGWIQSKDIPVGCVQSINDRVIPWISARVPGDTSVSLFGSYSIYTRAHNEGVFTTLHWYNAEQHDLGLKAPLYKDTTITLMSSFFASIIASIDGIDSLPQEKRENSTFQRTYLVQRSKSRSYEPEVTGAIPIRSASSRETNR